MRKIKEVLRLKWEQNLTNRQIAKSCSISHSTAREYLLRAKQAGLSWPLCPDFDDAALENLLFPPAQHIAQDRRHMPPMDYIHRELKRKSVTLQLLWYEYKQANPEGYQYSQFCELYRRWAKKIDIYTFAEASLAQDLPSWIKAHVHAFEFFGGVAEILVPDNLKAGVTRPCRYEPDINPTYQDLDNTTAPPLSLRGLPNPGTKPKLSQPYLLPNVGYWQLLETTDSST